MLSSRKSVVPTICAVLLWFVLTSTSIAQQRSTSDAITCPASIYVSEQPAPVPGWKGGPSRARHSFERITVYNEAEGREFELAPDDEQEAASKITQTWDLSGYRTMKLFVRCRYHDTSTVLVKEIPPAMIKCTFNFSLNTRDGLISKSDMVCR